LETIHPTREGMKDFEALFGIDAIKEALTDELALILDRKRLDAWHKHHHANGLGILDVTRSTLPLILLSGDVRCGTTALASSCANCPHNDYHPGGCSRPCRSPPRRLATHVPTSR